MKIGDKTFMNLQEAVGWLLENNALPFQSTANYAPNTEIALNTLVAPSPAKVRVGSLIFFADSKVSTVVGVTSNAFIVSDQYNDLVDDIVYVSNVAVNASGHLIVTLSNGDTIDAGLIKQVTNFNINASQHLIANYNDGTSTDLGAIFQGNVNISGNLSVSGNATINGGVSANAVTGNSIIENMSGYSYTKASDTPNITAEDIYAGVVKNGNKITFVLFTKITRISTYNGDRRLGSFQIPADVLNKLYPFTIGSINNYLDVRSIATENSTDLDAPKTITAHITKGFNAIYVNIRGWNSLTQDVPYLIRYEATFLLSENLAS